MVVEVTTGIIIATGDNGRKLANRNLINRGSISAASRRIEGYPRKSLKNTTQTLPTNEERDIVEIAVETPQGPLIGRLRYTPGGGSFRSFEGIPYAVPPTEENRFRDPVAIPTWTEPRYATQQGPMCTQFDWINSTQIIGQEDCLYLNVYTPDPISDVLYPVLFYIHGGSFTSGSSQYAENPDLFVEDGVIVVAINYRLGVFGFMNLGIEDVPGNAGHKDQVFALRWVAHNIQSLGGDPYNIAVAGHSAGSYSVHYLHFSEMSNRLFQKMIPLGASPMADLLLYQENPLEAAESLGRMLGVGSANPVNFVQELRSLSTSDIMEAIHGGIAADDSIQPALYNSFATTREVAFTGRESFFTRLPYEYLEDGNFPSIPTLIGYTSKEGTVFYSDYEDLLNDPYTFVRRKWSLVEGSEEMEETIRSVKEYYFGTQNLNISDPNVLLRLLELKGDTMIILSVIEVARSLVRHGSGPTYLMRFSYRGGLNFAAVDIVGMQGATHGDELGYFLPREEPRVDDYSRDGWVRRRLGKLISNFVKYSNPTPNESTHLLPSSWLPVTPDVVNYMDVNSEPIRSRNPERAKLRFWNALEQSILESNSAPRSRTRIDTKSLNRDNMYF